MTYTAPIARLQDLAQEQWGLVTRRQIEDEGLASTTVERLTSPGGGLERVAYGVYRLAGSPIPDHLDLRAAWLQLVPQVPVWARTAEQGVVSHRSAASLYGLGDLPADRHEFTVPRRKQTRRPDVRIHVRSLEDGESVVRGGLPVTRPSRIASDLLAEREDPEAVARVTADAIRRIDEYPGTFVDALAPRAPAYGFRRGDGLGLLRWLLDKAGDPDRNRWIDEALVHVARNRAGM